MCIFILIAATKVKFSGGEIRWAEMFTCGNEWQSPGLSDTKCQPLTHYAVPAYLKDIAGSVQTTAIKQILQ